MKRGAIELSVSTIVIVVIAIVMLILGITMTRGIMCKSIHGLDMTDAALKEYMRNMFGQEEKLAVAESSNEVAKGVNYAAAFILRNDGAESNSFSYSVEVSDIGDCTFSESTAESFMVVGKSQDKIIINSGEDIVGRIIFEIPKETENCNIRYKVTALNDGEFYGVTDFDIKIVNKKFTQNLC